MNPYIEQSDLWSDFHDTFIPAAREVLAAMVRPRYYVRIEEHLVIHEPTEGEEFPFGRPDLSVHPNPDAADGGAGGTAVAAPAYVGMPQVVEEERLSYLEIRDAANGDVVTIFELLSPANKATGPTREQYLAKLQRALASQTNFVEIDLLRGGPRMPWAELPACDYYAVVSRPADRAGENPRAGIWAVGLRERLPVIPVPLRPGEAEPMFDIQAIVHRAYDAAGYEMFIYRGAPEPALPAAQAVWAAQILHPPA